MFQIIGAMAEFERSMIQVRVKAGLRSARAKGTALGRPRVAVDTATIAALHARGASWRALSRQIGVSVRTAKRAAL
jgi:DNA invertase Pin-like site-specific DNA recombinase